MGLFSGEPKGESHFWASRFIRERKPDETEESSDEPAHGRFVPLDEAPGTAPSPEEILISRENALPPEELTNTDIEA
ncbi:MAG: hypothetical protein WC052_02130 [Patescibacteria group bacterium]|jgi:hypothetical protein